MNHRKSRRPPPIRDHRRARWPYVHGAAQRVASFFRSAQLLVTKPRPKLGHEAGPEIATVDARSSVHRCAENCRSTRLDHHLLAARNPNRAQVVILCGDVHYAFASRTQYWSNAKNPVVTPIEGAGSPNSAVFAQQCVRATGQGPSSAPGRPDVTAVDGVFSVAFYNDPLPTTAAPGTALALALGTNVGCENVPFTRQP